MEAQLRSDEASKASLFRPRAIPSALRSYVAFKDRLRDEYGLSYGMDYNLLYQHADKSLGEQNAAGGVLRLFGTWTLFDQTSAHAGSIEFKVEDRHRLGTEVAPASLAGQIGYAGLTAVPFSDAGTILTNLYWHQSFLENRLAYIVGIVDVTDYVGVYGLVNPWTDFINLAFSTGAVRTAPPSAPPATTNTPWRPTTAFSSSSAWRLRPTCN